MMITQGPGSAKVQICFRIDLGRALKMVNHRLGGGSLALLVDLGVTNSCQSQHLGNLKVGRDVLRSDLGILVGVESASRAI